MNEPKTSSHKKTNVRTTSSRRQTTNNDRWAPANYANGRWFSFKAALSGAVYTVRTQPNARIELVAAMVVILLGWWLDISKMEWAILGLTVSLILALEAVNTAVESIVDLVSPEYHPLAKHAKDAAAGAQVFAVAGSLWVALFILVPHLWRTLFGA